MGKNDAVKIEIRQLKFTNIEKPLFSRYFDPKHIRFYRPVSPIDAYGTEYSGSSISAHLEASFATVIIDSPEKPEAASAQDEVDQNWQNTPSSVIEDTGQESQVEGQSAADGDDDDDAEADDSEDD